MGHRHLTKGDIQMENKHMKGGSTSYVIMELHIKMTRYHHTPIGVAEILNTHNTKCWWGHGATGTDASLVGSKMVQPLGKII